MPDPAAATLLSVGRPEDLIGLRMVDIVRTESHADLLARMQHLTRVGDANRIKKWVETHAATGQQS